jgi:hypothetical protein
MTLRIDDMAKRVEFLKGVSDFINQTFKTPRSLLSAVELRVRANKTIEPTDLWDGLYVDTKLGVLTNRNGHPETWKGNCSIYSTQWLARAYADCPEYAEQMLNYLAIKREFRYIDRAFQQHSTLPRTLLAKVAGQYASPIFQSQNAVAPGKYSGIGLVMGNRCGPCGISRSIASSSAETAYDYAQNVDGHAEDVTRRGVSRSAEWSLRYAKEVDGCYNPLTYGGVLSAPSLWGKYAATCPETKEMFEPRISEDDAHTLTAYVDATMPKTERVIRMAFSKLPWNSIAKWLDSTISDVIKDSVYEGFLSGKQDADLVPFYVSRTKDKADRFVQIIVARGTAKDAYEYCRNVEEPVDCLRTKACTDPNVALNFAKYIDNKWHEETRKAVLRYAETAYDYADYFQRGDDELRAVACKSPNTAMNYALSVDRHPHPLTEEATSYTGYTADRYRAFVEQYNKKAIAVINKGDNT